MRPLHSRIDAPGIWEAVPPKTLPARAVHVWLAECRAVAAKAELWLDATERERARNCGDAMRRMQYTAARGALRAILLRYEGPATAALPLHTGPGGKPRLPAGTTNPPLEFNVSHSGSYAVVAVARGGPVGVDIEMRKDGRPVIALARRFFSPAEAAALESLDSAARQTAFYRIWTRKEALVKALGTGLRHSLKAFTVSAGPAAPQGNALIASSEAVAAPDRWRIIPLPAAPGCEGALAVPYENSTLGFYRFEI